MRMYPRDETEYTACFMLKFLLQDEIIYNVLDNLADIKIIYKLNFLTNITSN